MIAAPFERRRDDGYLLSTERGRLDVARIHNFLVNESYWGRDVTRSQLERALAGSLPIGIYAPDGTLASFGRLVTDYAAFAYLRDVFTLTPHRGRGLASWLAEAIREHPELSTVTTWMLFTRDAQSVYERAGFRRVSNPECYMRVPKKDEA